MQKQVKRVTFIAQKKLLPILKEAGRTKTGVEGVTVNVVEMTRELEAETEPEVGKESLQSLFFLYFNFLIAFI